MAFTEKPIVNHNGTIWGMSDRLPRGAGFHSLPSMSDYVRAMPRRCLLALAVAVLLQLAVIHLPFMHGPFNTVPMHAYEWVMAMTLGVSVFAAETLRKIVAPRLFSLGKWKPVRWPTSAGSERAKPSRDPSP